MNASDTVDVIMAGLAVVDGRAAWPRAREEEAREALDALPPAETEEAAVLLLAATIRLQRAGGDDVADACAQLVGLVVDYLGAEAVGRALDGLEAAPESHEEKLGGRRQSRVPVKADARAGDSPMGVRFPGLSRKKKR